MTDLSHEGHTHGCHSCGEERVAARVRDFLICPDCHSENIVCIDWECSEEAEEMETVEDEGEGEDAEP